LDGSKRVPMSADPQTKETERHLRSEFRIPAAPEGLESLEPEYEAQFSRLQELEPS